jgi:O-antigen/teichoic acid export membrane protein
MLKILKSATKNSLIYGMGNLSIKLVGLVLIPIYTNTDYLSVSEFGALGLLDISSQFLSAVLGFSLTQGLTRWYWDPKYSGKQKTIFFTALVFVSILCTFTFLATLLQARNISQLLFSTEDYSYVVVMVVLSSLLQVVIYMIQSLMKLQEKPVFYSITNVIKLLFTLLFTIYFVLSLKRKLDGIYEAQVIGSVIFLLVTIPYLWKNISFRFEKNILVELLRYCYPLMLASVSGILLASQDRYVLNYLSNLDSVAIYTLSYRISNTIKIIVVTSVQMAISPILFKMLDDPNNKRFYSKYMTYFTFGVMIFVLALNLFGYEILKIFTHDMQYWKAYKLLPILNYGVLFGMMRDTSLLGLQITKKTKIIGTLIFFIALLNLGLNFLLIPRWSYYGSSAATLVSEFIFFILVYAIAQKAYTIPYEAKKLMLMIAVSLVLLALSYPVNGFNVYLRISLKLGMILSFPFILMLFGFYEAIEIERIRGAIRKWTGGMIDLK